MIRRRYTLIPTIVATLAVWILISLNAMAAPVRHIICDQLDWQNSLGLILEIINDQTKDDAIAPLKTASISAGLGTGKNWRFLTYGTTKWEMNKEYSLKFIVLPALAELWLDGKKRNSNKGSFVVFESKPEINGVPEWATGEAAYGVYVKSIRITTSEGNDYEAEYDLESWDARIKSTVPEDWQLAPDDTSFTIEVVFSFLSVE